VKWRRHAWVAVAALATALGLAAASPAAGLTRFDDVLRDIYFRVRGPVEPGPDIVIVSIDDAALRARGPWPWDAAVIGRVVEAIRSANARAVVLTFPPPPGLALPAGVVRPRAIEPSPLEAQPFRALEPPTVTAGIDVLPPQGTVRVVPLFFDLEGEPGAASLALAALRASGVQWEIGRDEVRVEGLLRTEILPRGGVRVNFVGPDRSFPYLGIGRVLDGDLAPGTFAGKVVLIGPTSPAIDDGVATPTTLERSMPRVEVLANALDTLFRGRGFRRPPLAAAAVVLGSVLFLFAFAFRQVRPAVSLALAAVVVLAAAAGCFFAFTRGIAAPTLSFLVGTLAAYGGLTVLRESELDADVDRLLDELLRLDRRFYVSSDEDADASRWARCLDLAALFLDVESLLLFRCEPESPYLRFVAGYRATEADVAERRRDMRRSPYRDALDPMRQVVRSTFLKEELDQATLFVPIVSVTRTLGFLLVSRRRGREETFAEQRELIRFIAQQIATLVQREELAPRDAQSRVEILARLVKSDRIARRFDSLATVARSILEKKNLLFSTVNAIEDGVIVSDMFGRVVLYNARINATAERVGTTIEGRNVIDLVHELSGLERREIIRRLSAVVMGEPLTLEIQPTGRGGRHYRLTLSAVRHRGGGPQSKEQGPVLGLVALFSDITSLKELDAMKTGLLNMVSYRVLNILASIQGYAELIREAPGLSGEEREFADTIVAQSISLTGVFDAFHAMANLDTGAPGAKMAPIDLVEVVRRSYREAEKLLAERGGARGGGELALEAPDRFDIVAADQSMLGKAIVTVMAFALENAERGTPLKVSIAEEERYIRIDIANRGFGVPGDVLPTLFDGGTTTPEREGANLRMAKDVFELHGGSVKADAVVGEGVRFHLWLPLFMRGADVATPRARG
jgi:CHASE2 domain-containing sensor protein/signal transduction histidine kinase